MQVSPRRIALHPARVSRIGLDVMFCASSLPYAVTTYMRTLCTGARTLVVILTTCYSVS